MSSLQPIKKKGTVKQKIKEREEQERRRAELGLGSEDEDDEEDEQMDLAERRRMEKEAQIKADVENAANLLGTAKMASDEGASSLKPAKLSTKEDWEAFSDDIYRTVVKAHSSKPGFDRFFVPHFAKLLAENLRDVDCRKQSTHWKTIADEKTKLEKEKKAGGAKTKTAAKPKTVGTSSAKNTIDMRSCGFHARINADINRAGPLIDIFPFLCRR